MTVKSFSQEGIPFCYKYNHAIDIELKDMKCPDWDKGCANCRYSGHRTITIIDERKEVS